MKYVMIGIGLIVGALGILTIRATVIQTCTNDITNELFWFYRLSSSEVQEDLAVKQLTANMYVKSIETRIESCNRMYEYGFK